MSAQGVVGVYNGTKFVRAWCYVYYYGWQKAIPYVQAGLMMYKTSNNLYFKASGGKYLITNDNPNGWKMVGGAGTLMIPYLVSSGDNYNVSDGEVRLVREDPE